MVGYVKPETKSTKPIVTQKEETVEASQPTAWVDPPARPIMASDMINATGDGVSKSFTDMFERYIAILEGTKAVDVSKLGDEQILFMRTVSNSLSLSFDRYCVVTDWLVLRIRQNAKVLTHENIFRLIRRIPGNAYKANEIERYKKYMMALLVLSENLQNRQRIGRLIDIASLAGNYKASVGQNITQYFQRNYS